GGQQAVDRVVAPPAAAGVARDHFGGETGFERHAGVIASFPGRSAARSAAEWCAADPGSTRAAPGPRVCTAALRAAVRRGTLAQIPDEQSRPPRSRSVMH